MKGWEWIVILVLALVLFGGAKKLPDAARGLGRSLRIFKAETKGLVNGEPDAAADASPAHKSVTLPRTDSGEQDADADPVRPGPSVS